MAEEGQKDGDLQQELEVLYEKIAGADPQDGDRKRKAGFEDEDIDGPDEPERWDPPPPPGPRFRLDRTLRAFWTAPPYPGIVLCALLLLGSAGIALWPSLYHYGAVDLGGGSYPLRVNRLTGEATYYDGSSWIKPPAAAAPGKSRPAETKSPPPPAPPSPDSLPASPPAAPAGKPAVAPALPSEDEKPAPHPPAAAGDIRQAPFTIQVRAFPEERKKEALAFQERLGKKRPGVFLETVPLGKRGVWHRVLLGAFATREDAAAYRRKAHLAREFPDSFVQKRSGANP
ncbi:MAG TPA: SPOR domain-containing protein [Syntrophales bacterium]|nr:SPOR domain-containing protein [Syntrophales bacterium]